MKTNGIVNMNLKMESSIIRVRVDEFNGEGKVLAVTNINAMTGVGNKYRKRVVEEITNVLEELGGRW